MPNTYIPSRLDQALFGAPFIVIGADNDARTITHRLDDAVATLNSDSAARAVVGTLRHPLLAIDIDPEDTGASAEAGEVVAEQLLLWADHYGLPWLRRESGRPGHTHLVIKTPPSLHDELQLIVRTVAARQNVSATVRSTLRLTSSPHRHELPSPILSCTLKTTDVSQPIETGPRRAARPARRRGGSDRSRSEGEYGHALALARAGHTTAHAWAFANLAETKAREIGEKAWRRWFWAPATTIIAAENGLTEQQAWDLFHQASPTQAAHIGRAAWRRRRWLPAIREAADIRPRRRRLGLRQATDNQIEPSSRRLRQVRAVLQAAVDRYLEGGFSTATRTGVIAGVRVSSLRAALDAFAHAVLTTRGSISVRLWAERAGLDPKTVRRARDVALKLGILERVHRYAGGESDCDAFILIEKIAAENNTKSTSPTPYTPTRGKADILRLRSQHQRDRRQFALNNQRTSTTNSAVSIPLESTRTLPRIQSIAYVPGVRDQRTSAPVTVRAADNRAQRSESPEPEARDPALSRATAGSAGPNARRGGSDCQRGHGCVDATVAAPTPNGATRPSTMMPCLVPYFVMKFLPRTLLIWRSVAVCTLPTSWRVQR
ncbi:hypothetical protein [Amycolatopsis sp. NPDC051128]|uniref:hypothetical protein n=1 Tax=Amycolatopsis sp. NPDC051128 TaxID=3155412 RepID=UPI003437D307